MLALLMGCDAETPAAFDKPVGYEAVRDIMDSPIDESTIARLNIALGRDADARVHVASVLSQGEVLIMDNSTGEKLWATIAASGGGDDVVCTFENGGSIGEYNDFVSCQQAHPDCDLQIQTENHIQGNSVTVVITELQIVCQESLIGYDPRILNTPLLWS